MAPELSTVLRRRSRFYITGLLGVLTAIDAVAIDVLIPAMPQMRRAFSIDAAQAAATLSIFMLGLAMGQCVYGPLSDRIGRKPPLLAGLLVFVLGSVLPLSVQTFASLMIGRFLQALGAAAGMVVARAVVVDVFPEEESARQFSILIQILGVATIVAPIVGGYLAVAAGWQSIFVLLASLGIACLLAVMFTFEETHVRRDTAASFGSQLKGAAVLLADRGFVAQCLAAGCVMAGMLATLVGNAFIFVDSFGWSPMFYAIVYAAGCLGFVVVGFLNTLALRRWQPAPILAWGLTSVAIAAVVLLWVGNRPPVASIWVAVLTMSQLAILGFVFGNIGALAMSRARESAGTGSSLFGISQYAMGALAGPVATVFGGSALHSTSLTAAFFYCGAAGIFFAGGRSR